MIFSLGLGLVAMLVLHLNRGEGPARAKGDLPTGDAKKGKPLGFAERLRV
jgi:hypothetical protein